MKLRWVLLLVLLSICCTVSAQEPWKEADKAPPEEILAKMPARAISLAFAEYPIGPNKQKVLVHAFATPFADRPKGDGTGPYKREDYHALGVPRSRYFAEFFLRESGGLKRVNRVSFEEEDGITGIQLLWLEPKSKHTPIVALHIGVSHWQGWQMILFPDGVNGSAIRQRFLYGGEGDTSNTIDFMKVDRRGKMIVHDDWSEGEKHGERTYLWDGVEFADRSRPYFMIAASLKTRGEAESFVETHQFLGDGDIRPSSHYPKLTPGYFVVIVSRFTTVQDANAQLKELRKQGLDCYVKRAF